jgi:hypothetical protein
VTADSWRSATPCAMASPTAPTTTATTTAALPSTASLRYQLPGCPWRSGRDQALLGPGSPAQRRMGHQGPDADHSQARRVLGIRAAAPEGRPDEGAAGAALPLDSARCQNRRAKQKGPIGFSISPCFSWSGREDLNLRPPEPHSGALPGCATPRGAEHPIDSSGFCQSTLQDVQHLFQLYTQLMDDLLALR